MKPLKSLAVAVFVKTPGLSPIKTRLAHELGEAETLKFYKGSLINTQALVEDFRNQARLKVKPYWAIAEEEGLSDPLWTKWPKLLQEGSGLGARMFSIYQELKKKNEFVLLLGADCPHLPVEYLLKADQILYEGKFNNIVGPTDDGGFYLFASCEDFSEQLWRKPEYSKSSTLDQFQEALGLDSKNCFTLPQWFDIDTIEDYNRLKN